jgi:SAM-dependent methyltransferase
LRSFKIYKKNVSPPEDWVVKHFNKIKKGGSVMDMAAGKGRHTQFFLDKGYNVVAVDQNITSLSIFNGHPKLRIVKADLETNSHAPFNAGVFNGIVVVNYLYRPIFQQIIEMLDTGGVLIFQTFMVGNELFGRPRNRNYLLLEDELKNFFSKELLILDSQQGYSDRPSKAVTQKICAIKK